MWTITNSFLFNWNAFLHFIAKTVTIGSAPFVVLSASSKWYQSFFSPKHSKGRREIIMWDYRCRTFYIRHSCNKSFKTTKWVAQQMRQIYRCYAYHGSLYSNKSFNRFLAKKLIEMCHIFLCRCVSMTGPEFQFNRRSNLNRVWNGLHRVEP